MVKIVFTNVPRKYKKAFQIGLISGHSKKLDVEQANDIVINVAKSLELEDEFPISFTVIDDQGTTSDIKDAIVNAEDGSTGLVNVMNRVADENGNDEDSLEILGLITGSLQPAKPVEGEIVDDDPDDEEEFNPWEHPETADTEEKGEAIEEEPSSLDGAEPEKDSNVEEEELEPSFDESSTKENVADSDSSADNGKSYDPTKINIESFNNEEDDPINAENFMDNKPKASEPRKEKSLEEKAKVISIQEFANTDEIFASLKNYDADKFNIQEVIESLGYVDQPQDKYQRELNTAILQKLDDSGLSQIKSTFTSEVEKLKQEAKSKLTDSYSEIQDKPVAQAVEEATSDEILQAQQDANSDIDEYVAEADNKINEIAKQYSETVTQEVEKYRQELKTKYQNLLNNDRAAEQENVDKLKGIRQEKLEEKINDIKSKAEGTIINERNSALATDRQDIDNKFQDGINSLYQEQSKKYSDGVIALRDLIAKKANEIDKQKAADEAEALRIKHEEEDRAEQKRLNDLKERELKLKEKEAEAQRDYNKKKLALKAKNNKERNKAELERQKREFELKQKEIEAERERNEAQIKRMSAQKAEELNLRKQDIALRKAELHKKSMRYSESYNPDMYNIEPPEYRSSVYDSVTHSPSNSEYGHRPLSEPYMPPYNGYQAFEQRVPKPLYYLYDKQMNLNKDLSQDLRKDEKKSSDDQNSESSEPHPESATPVTIQNESSNQKNYMKFAYFMGAVALSCLVLGTGIFGYSLGKQHVQSNVPSQTASTQKTNASVNSDDKKAITDKSVNNKQKSKNTVRSDKTQLDKANDKKISLNLKAYQAAKTWQQKVDILNGCLGQHDDRALKEINDSKYSSKLSRLYEAIVLKDDASVRSIYQQMSPEEKKDMSRTALESTAMAFYNVQDWQGGWEARNGI